MRTGAVIIISAICALSSASALSPGGLATQGVDTSYLPLRIGNQWTFVREGEQKTERIIDTTRIMGELYFRFDTLSYQPNVLLRESGPRVYRYLDTN